MWGRGWAAFGAVCALAVAGAPGATAQEPAPLTPEAAAALGSEAALYGFPLLEVLRVRETATSVRCPDGRGNAPVNAFSNARRTATPADRTVVAPNVDTRYSLAHLDLGRGPVVLSHPDMGRRYFVFQLLDPYTNTIGYIGSRTTGSKAGRFAITWTGRPGRRPRGTRRVSSPSRRVWVIGRTLVDGARDDRRASRRIARFRLRPPGGARRFARDCRPGPTVTAATPAGLDLLGAINRGLAQNPPPERDGMLLRRLAAIGVGAGRDPERAGLTPDALQALSASVARTLDALPDLAKALQLEQARAGGGWALPADAIGDYGTDYRFRAGVAELGLGANTREEAIYPTAFLDAAGEALDGANAYRIVIGPDEVPPARAFWSLTAYDADGFLVRGAPRYAVGPTHRPLRRRADGSIVILVQRRRPSPRAANWLPVPASPFRLNLRLYDPEPAALTGRWTPPPIQRVPPPPTS